MNHRDLKKLSAAGIHNAAQEYSWLKKYATSANQLSTWVDERANGRPLAYIIGHVDFYGLNLIVNEHVLIPRIETEELVEHILNHTSNLNTYNILDLGCGSGAIALAIKKHLPKCNVFALDLSPEALSIALRNQAKYPNIEVHWIQGNWLNAINLDHIDIIISNPPYVESSWKKTALAHEPNEALYSGADGLDDIKSIVNQFKEHKHLEIWFEHGHQHDLSKIAGSSWNINKLYDHSGSQRFTHLSCNQKYV